MFQKKIFKIKSTKDFFMQRVLLYDSEKENNSEQLSINWNVYWSFDQIEPEVFWRCQNSKIKLTNCLKVLFSS